MAVRWRACLNIRAALLGVTVQQTPIERTREHDDERHDDDELPVREIRQPDHHNGSPGACRRLGRQRRPLVAQAFRPGHSRRPAFGRPAKAGHYVLNTLR